MYLGISTIYNTVYLFINKFLFPIIEPNYAVEGLGLKRKFRFQDFVENTNF